ncbi:hypothetical protein M422DRAFT_94644, partial [Sphaerobolus stellatus SS14]
LLDDYPKIFALLIGIDKYQSPSIRPLRSCVADVDDMTALLTQDLSIPLDHLHILKNEQATRSNIIDSIKAFQFGDRMKLHDQLLIYFGGHASQVKR